MWFKIESGKIKVINSNLGGHELVKEGAKQVF
jgi:hypothetical protein